MRRVTCECGQSFFPFLTNGVPREACPFCKTKLTLNSDGSLAGTTPAASPPSQRVSELQKVVAEPQPMAPPPARYPCEVLPVANSEDPYPAVRNEWPKGCVAVNLWRDRNRLVVAGEWATFPSVCVLTGRTNNLISMPYTVTFLSHRWVWVLLGLFFGLIGGLILPAIAQAHLGTSLSLVLPVCSQWLAKKRSHLLIGMGIVFVSGLLFVIGSFVYMANWRNDSQNPMNFLLLTVAGGFVGIIYLAAAWFYGRLVCNRMEGNCMWLAGASPAFLKHLPEWRTTGPVGAPGVLYRS